MNPRLLVFILFILLGFAGLADASMSSISREEIQAFMKKPGNAMADPVWARNYQNRSVKWHGTVYKVGNWGENQESEILVKVLSDSHLYDTVITLPPNHSLVKTAKIGQTVEFGGIITGAVDTMLMKEVHLMFYNPVKSNF